MIKKFLVAALMVLALVLASARSASAQVPVLGTPDTLLWDYNDADVPVGPVTQFVVCLDSQTTGCPSVLVSSVTVNSAPGVKTYTWKFPAMLPAAHTVSVQACTATTPVPDCSAPNTLAFTVKIVIAPVFNERIARR